MLVRTGGTAPAAVQSRLEKVLGADAAVTPVDKASRLGLDPGAAQVAVVTGTVADAVGVFRYTVLSGGRIAPDPAWVSAHISTETVPILGSVTCNTADLPAAQGRPPGDRRPRPRRQDQPRRVRRLLLPPLHRRLQHALQPRLRPRPRPQHPRQRPRHRRRDGPRCRRRLQELGLRLGRRLGLHRPHALRDGPARHPGGVSVTERVRDLVGGRRAQTVATTATTSGTCRRCGRCCAARWRRPGLGRRQRERHQRDADDRVAEAGASGRAGGTSIRRPAPAPEGERQARRAAAMARAPRSSAAVLDPVGGGGDLGLGEAEGREVEALPGLDRDVDAGSMRAWSQSTERVQKPQLPSKTRVALTSRA